MNQSIPSNNPPAAGDGMTDISKQIKEAELSALNLLKNKTKPFIMIATPMYGGMSSGLFTQSMLELQHYFSSKTNIGMTYAFIFNESLVTRARNDLVHVFLKSKCTHLMFIDADIGFIPEDIVNMIQSDKEIICGIYAKKVINWKSIQNVVKVDTSIDSMKRASVDIVVDLLAGDTRMEIKRDEPYPVRQAGAGFMLIKRSVFDKLADKVKTYINNGYVHRGELTREYFTTSIESESNELLSEDYSFCKMWRENGGTVYIAPWCNVRHVGMYIFGG